MNIIKYYSHLILHCKHRILIHLFIIFTIYAMAYSTNYAFCMTENSDIPQIAEAKDIIRPSHQVLALKKEITDFAGNYITMLEEKNAIIDHLKERCKTSSELVESMYESYNFLDSEYSKALAENEQLYAQLKKQEEKLQMTEWLESRLKEVEDHDIAIWHELCNARRELAKKDEIIAELKSKFNK